MYSLIQIYTNNLTFKIKKANYKFWDVFQMLIPDGAVNLDLMETQKQKHAVIILYRQKKPWKTQ